MDGFAYIVLGGLVSLLLFLFAIARWYPGSGADIVDWRPTRSYETEMQLELEDVDQMLEAQNERRRARGERERSREEVELDVASVQREQGERADTYRGERAAANDLDELLALANARRRRRGQPRLTAAQLRAELDSNDDR